MNFNFNGMDGDEIAAEIQRAVETVATTTWSPGARSIFSPENLDYRVKLLVPTDTPLRNRFPRTTGYGEAASWLKMTSKLDPTVNGTNTTIFFGDGNEPSETSQTYSAATATYQLLGRKIEVGLKAIQASKGRPGGLGTMFDERVGTKIIELMLGEEQALIAADSDVSNNYNGLLKTITTNSGTMTFTTASGMQQHFETMHNSGGDPDLYVANARQMRALSDELSNTGSVQRIVYQNANGIMSGSRVRGIINDINGTEVEMLVSRYIGACALLLQLRTAAGENCIEVEDLLPISAIDKDLAGVKLTRYIVEISTLKVIHEPWQMKFAGLATT